VSSLELIEAAREAKQMAYCPESSYPVGAAVETSSGEMYRGANVEIINYSGTLHAEETAVIHTYLQEGGFNDIERLAVSHNGSEPPCGRCRQFLAEFFEEEFKILVDGNENSPFTIGELLPGAMEEI
jgi:cytidine deaminase